MTNNQALNPAAPKRLAIEADELRNLAEGIIQSGVLGRSRVYTALLRYLVDCAITGSNPKEIEIAIEVLGRDTDFDVAKDSAVRVYIHQLRKKLDRYYDQYQQSSPHRLVIPKGQYTVEALATETGDPRSGFPQAPGSSATTDKDGTTGKRRAGVWPIAITVLLAANLLYFLIGDLPWDRSPHQAIALHPTWRALLSDEIPILVVMGDYYIFGELDEAGNVARMIRDFDVNSKEDLDNLFAEKPELGWQYYDLNLSYLPEGSAFALASIASVLRAANKPVNVKMMSEVNTRDLQRNHIVYIGYVSALDRINKMVFSVSGLSIGENYDQLITKDGREVYTSDAGLPSFDKPFIDYGWFITFPTTQKTRMVVIAGMRDSGLVHTAQTVTELSGLRAIDDRLAESEETKSTAHEALFQVRGLDRMNFDAQLEYTSYLNARGMWQDELEEPGAK